jgi:hypothetical protein
MNPPRPTPAKVRAMVARLQRVINESDAMLQGNVKSTDAFRLSIVRESRDALRIARGHLEKLT